MASPSGTGTSRSGRSPLSGDDWADAALDAIAEGGIEAVAVERIARTLRVTKGSFYWHFGNRDALLEAALGRWEREQTESVIGEAEREGDPRRRLARLFRQADGSKRAGQLYLTLTAGAADPAVGAVVQRVNARRLRFLEDCFEQLGLASAAARQRAVLAYSVYLGTLQLRRDAPETIPAGAGFHEYLEHVNRVLIPGYDASA